MNTDASEPRPTNVLSAVVRAVLKAHVGRVPLAGIIAAVAVVALLNAAYQLGSPPADAALSASTHTSLSEDGVRMQALPAASEAAAPGATAAPAAGFGSDSSGPVAAGGVPVAPNNAPLETIQIVKTGSLTLEITDLDKAVAQAQSTIAGMGGYVADSNRSGDKDSAVATITYRLPVARWDDALAAMRGLASRVVSEQTNAADITAQVVDLDARLSNLKATEAALQAIMAKATLIADVLAVEEQLGNTQGQIEELTAQRDNFKDQAQMSTLAVTFSLPGPTVTAQTTQQWSLGAQVDEAGAALVRIGQGLATIGVWALIVGVPVAIGLAVLLLILWVLRRFSGRRGGAAVSA